MKNFKKVIGCVSMLIILGIIIAGLSTITERKNSKFKYIPFFEEKNNFDVLFFGTSHVIDGIYPMELWNDYGIVSYNWGGHSNELATSYWVMRNALEYTHPKLVVIDVKGVDNDILVSETPEYIHLSLDCFPLSHTKYETVCDLFPEAENKWEYLFDFGIYHNRWNELTEDDFQVRKTKEKGAETMIAVAKPYDMVLIDRKLKNREETTGKEYLRKMIAYCQEKGIEVLLIHIPYPTDESKLKWGNSVDDIAEEYGVPYINFMYEDVINYNTDCYDLGSHLNASGAKKVTDFLGQYITENFPVENHKEDENYASWLEDYKIYTDDKLYRLKAETNFYNYLMLLADKNLYCSFKTAAQTELWKDEKFLNLKDNIKNIVSLDELTTDEGEADIVVTVMDAAGNIVDEKSFQADKQVNYIQEEKQ